MDITFKEYIAKHYNVADRIRARIINPKEIIKNRDDLPYDDIIFIDDELQKVVYISDEVPISVAELLSYTREDILKIKDQDLITVYDNYMEQVDMRDADIIDLISAAQVFMKDKRTERMRMLGCIQ